MGEKSRQPLSELRAILNDPSQKKAAALKLSARIRELNRSAKAAKSPEERKRLYKLKVALAEWGIKDFGLKVLSYEYSDMGRVIVCRLKDGFRSTVHLPLKDFAHPELINLADTDYRVTLKPNRATNVSFGLSHPAYR